MKKEKFDKKTKTEWEKQKAFIQQLKKEGYLVFKLNDSFISGLPDILAIKDGKVRFIELKNKDLSGSCLSLAQLHLHEKMKKKGIEVEVFFI